MKLGLPLLARTGRSSNNVKKGDDNGGIDDLFDGGVFAVFNFSGRSQSVSFQNNLHHGGYSEYLSSATASFDAGTTLNLPPWSHRVFRKQDSQE